MAHSIGDRPGPIVICIVDGDRIGEWIVCETKEQFEAEAQKLIEQDIDFAVNPNW